MGTFDCPAYQIEIYCHQNLTGGSRRPMSRRSRAGRHRLRDSAGSGRCFLTQPMALLEIAKLVNDFCEGFLPHGSGSYQDESVAKKTW
jgi:hypothetical protein